jgi:hypothetical protein
MPNLSRYRKGIASAALVVVVVHLSLCGYFASDTGNQLSHTTVGIFYRRLVLLGPFFSEDRIRSSSHLYVRYKQEGREWSLFTDESEQSFRGYWRQPWRYDLLMLRNYARSLSSSISAIPKQAPFGEIKGSEDFKKLHAFVVRDFPGDHRIDSIQVVCVTRRYVPEERAVHIDTVFNFNYNPREIGSSR